MIKFHIDPNTGDPRSCTKPDECAWAKEKDHFSTAESARAAYETMMSVFVIAPSVKKKQKPAELTAAAFEAFKSSEASKAPALPVDGWREKIASDAHANGDAAADANPDTSVSGYFDASVQDDDDEDDFNFEPF